MKKILVAVLALVLVMTSSFALADEVIKVGVIGPLTGPYAQYGLGVQYAAEIAAAELTANGTLNMVILAEDDQGDGEASVNAYHKLLDEGCVAILGTVTSGACAEVSSEAVSDRVFMLTPSATADSITDGKDMLFRVCFKDSAQGSASATYIAEKNLATKIGVIYNNSSDYSTGIYQSFKAKAAEMGLEIVAVSAFAKDTDPDFSVQIAQMKDAGAELVFLPIYYTPAAMILAQSKAAEYAPIFFGVDGMDGILGLEGFDTTLAEGVLLLTPFAADKQDEATQHFVKAYTDLHNDIPNQFAADAYDGAYILAQAMIAAGVTADSAPEDVCDALAAAMLDITFEGITGTMTWDASGEVTKSPMAVVIKDGAYVLAE